MFFREARVQDSATALREDGHQRRHTYTHATHATIGTTISTDASCLHVIHPSYSAALASVPSMIELAPTIEIGRVANQRTADATAHALLLGESGQVRSTRDT